MKTEGSLSVGSTVGLIRKGNEDACLVLRANFGRALKRDFELAIVCDGMGGMKGGRDASLTAVISFVDELLRDPDAPLEARAERGINRANAEIYGRFQGQGGTTLSALVRRRGGEAVIAHAGDTRIYLIRRQLEPEQLTRDDTLRAVLNKHQDNDDGFGSKLIQFVGMGEAFEPHIFAAPGHGTSFLLTSDGAHGMAHSTFSRVVNGSSGAADTVRRLLQLSDLLGGIDNASVVFVPAQFSEDRPSSSDDVILKFLTPYDTLEVFVPAANHFAPLRHQAIPSATQEQAANEVAEPSVTPTTKKPRRGLKKRKAGSNASSREPSLDLPSRDEISVEFPDKTL